MVMERSAQIPLHEKPIYKWLVTTGVIMGTFIYAMDVAIVNVALPHIMANFGMNLDKGQWVATAYMLTMAIMMPSTGWLGAKLGHRTLYAVSLAVFTTSSILCGLSWSGNSIIVFRAIQGLGGGAILPIAMVIFYDVFPEEQRGLAMGIFALGSIMGPALGPVVGGYLTDEINWRLIFFINVPFGVTGLLMTLLIMKETRPPVSRRLDIPGLIFLSLSLGSLLILLSKGHQESWLRSDYIRNLFIIFAGSLAAFIVTEIKTKQPFVEIQLFKNFMYSNATILSAVLGIGYYGSAYIVPIYLQKILPYTAFRAGIIMLPGALLFGAFLFTTGVLTGKVSPRLMVITGILVFSTGIYWLSYVSLQTTESTIVWMLNLRGIGLGLIFTPLMTLALFSLPVEQVSMGSGLFNVTRYIGGMFGIAVISTLVERRELIHVATYSEHQTYSSLATSTFLHHGEALFRSMGDTIGTAGLKSLALLNKMVVAERLLAAFSDVYLILGLISLSCIIPALMLRAKKVAAD